MLLARCVRGVVWLVVAEHVEDGFESAQVFLEEFDQPGVLGVANVPEQRKVLCCGHDFKVVVRRGRLQMKIRKDLYFHHAGGS